MLGNTSNKLSYLVVALLALTVGWYSARWSDYPDNPAGSPETVLAAVGNTTIDLDQFRSAMHRYGGLRPGQYQTLEQKRELLDLLIKQSVLVSAALRDGLDHDPEVSHVWNKLLADRYLELNLKPRLEKIRISDAQVQAYYDENQRKYIRPARRRAALILRDIGTSADAEKWLEEKQQMAAVRADVDALDPGMFHFGSLATQYSHERGSRYVGGVIGWFVNHPGRQYKWHQNIIDALFELENIGDTSPLIELPHGLALVRLVDLEVQQEKNFPTVATGVRNKLRHQRELSEKEAFREELAARQAIEINEGLLASVAPLSGRKQKTEKAPPALPSG